MGQAHCFIEGQLAVVGPENLPTLSLRSRLIWSRANYAAISSHVAAVDSETKFTGLYANNSYQLLVNVYNEAINLYIPSITTPFTEKQEQRVTTDLIKTVKVKRASWAKFINAGRDAHQLLKESHRTACKNITKMVKSARLNYKERLSSEFQYNSKRLHAHVQSKQSVRNTITLLETANSSITTDTGDICLLLNNYFHSVFVLESEGPLQAFESRTETICVVDPASFSIDIVQKCLYHLDERKLTGYDGVHPRVLSKCATNFAKPLSLIYKYSFATGVLPDLWRKLNVKPIFNESR
ncbi:uncharacterized protein LOC124809471 [Hydra vulgaris]|uniref:uncharacterized protein LOC124809471 n=1 Tax=Hydra vulgaris TaxID=6087 RepID=UPI001F5FAE05|nr:uncharacterized protein LOC124809471 [Hydra vulgaris]